MVEKLSEKKDRLINNYKNRKKAEVYSMQLPSLAAYAIEPSFPHPVQ